jgi:hypothetical protein
MPEGRHLAFCFQVRCRSTDFLATFPLVSTHALIRHNRQSPDNGGQAAVFIVSCGPCRQLATIGRRYQLEIPIESSTCDHPFSSLRLVGHGPTKNAKPGIRRLVASMALRDRCRNLRLAAHVRRPRTASGFNICLQWRLAPRVALPLDSLRLAQMEAVSPLIAAG